MNFIVKISMNIVSVILKSGKTVKRKRHRLRNVIHSTQECFTNNPKIFPSSPKIYGDDVHAPGLITHNSAPTQSPTIFHRLFPWIHLASSFQTNLTIPPLRYHWMFYLKCILPLSIFSNNLSWFNYMACFWFLGCAGSSNHFWGTVLSTWHVFAQFSQQP